MLIGAAPGVRLWPAAMIVWGPRYVSSCHAHHCVQWWWWMADCEFGAIP